MPENLKKEIKLVHFYIFIKRMSLLIILLTLSVAIVMLIGEIILQFHFNAATFSTSMVSKYDKESDLDIKNLKKKITSLKQIQDESTEPSKIINEVIKMTADGVKYSQMNIDFGQNALTLSGSARTREDLVALKDNLESSKSFSIVDFPIKNLLEKNDITFDIKIKINSYDFSNSQ